MDYANLLVIATFVTAVALVYSAILHLSKPSFLVATMINHDIVPFRLVRPTAALVIAGQLFSGVVGVASWWWPGSPRLVFAASAAFMALMCAAMAVYLRLVSQKRPGAPCGCFGGRTVAGSTTIARAGALGLGPALYVVDFVSRGIQPLAIACVVYVVSTLALARVPPSSEGRAISTR